MDVSSRLRNAHMCFTLESLEAWDALDLDHRMHYLQAISYLILRAERRGCSFRELIGDMGLYPEAMMVTELLDIHNALWSHYHEESSSNVDSDSSNIRHLKPISNSDSQ